MQAIMNSSNRMPHPAPCAAERQSFRRSGVRRTYIGGMIDAAEEAGAALIPTIACLTAAPTLTSGCARRVSDELIDAVRRHKDEIDGICLGLHGAGCSEDTDDLEGEVLERVREVVGAEIPAMVTLDLHANVSEKMVRLADGLFGIRQYPHIDMYDPGYLAMKTLISVLRTRKKPETALCALLRSLRQTRQD